MNGPRTGLDDTPRVSVEDIGAYDIGQASDAPGRYVIGVGGRIELVGTFGDLECLAFNILALVSGERMTVYRQIGGEL